MYRCLNEPCLAVQTIHTAFTPLREETRYLSQKQKCNHLGNFGIEGTSQGISQGVEAWLQTGASCQCSE